MVAPFSGDGAVTSFWWNRRNLLEDSLEIGGRSLWEDTVRRVMVDIVIVFSDMIRSVVLFPSLRIVELVPKILQSFRELENSPRLCEQIWKILLVVASVGKFRKFPSSCDNLS